MMISKTNTTIKALSFSLFLFGTLVAVGQKKFEVPENYELNTAADYAKYENAIISAAKWLEDTDLDKEIDKRQKVNAFVLKWIAGSPSVTIELSESIGKLCSKNEELSVYTFLPIPEACLKQKDEHKISRHQGSLQAIIKVYKKGIAITKNKDMDKLVKMSDDNKIDEFIRSYMNWITMSAKIRLPNHAQSQKINHFLLIDPPASCSIFQAARDKSSDPFPNW